MKELEDLILRFLRTRRKEFGSDLWRRRQWMLQQKFRKLSGNVVSELLIAGMHQYQLMIFEMRRKNSQWMRFARFCLRKICFHLATMITTPCWGKLYSFMTKFMKYLIFVAINIFDSTSSKVYFKFQDT